MATTSAITGRIVLPDNVAATDAVLRFVLSGFDTDQTDSDVIGPYERFVRLESDGDLPAGTVLWRNTEGLRATYYTVSVIVSITDAFGGMARRVERKLGNVQIGDDTMYDIAELLDSEVPEAIGTFWSAITEAQFNEVIAAAAQATALGSIYTETDAELAEITIDPGALRIIRYPVDSSPGQVAPVGEESTWYKWEGGATSEPYFTTAGPVVWVQRGYREQGTLSQIQTAIQAFGTTGLRAFESRAAAAAWIAANPAPPEGTIFRWGDVAIRYIGTGTAVTGFPGWVWADQIAPEVWAENTTPGTTNMRTALQSAVGNAASVYRRAFLRGIYLASTSFTMNLGTALYAEPTTNDATNRAGWMSKPGTLVLPTGATVTMGNGTSIENLLIRKDGLNTGAVNQAIADAYAGTALMIVSSGILVKNTTILGFEYGIDTGPLNNARVRFHDLQIDCKNGIRHRIDKGGAEFVRVRCEPILTGDDANNNRDGIGIIVDGTEVGGISGNDGPIFDSCFVFYRNGIDIKDANAVKMFGTMCDAPRTISEGFGLRIRGTSTEGHYSNFRAASHRDGVIINTVREDGRPCVQRFEGLNVWQNRDHGMWVQQGHVYINGGRGARSPASYQDPADLGIALKADGVGSIIYVDDYDFDSLKVAMSAVNGGIIYYGPNVRFGNDVVTRFEGDCRPMVAPTRIARSTVKPRFFTPTIAPGSGTLVMPANALQFWYVPLAEGYPIDRLEWEIVTGVAGNGILGIYSHDPQTNGPGDLLYQTASISTASPAIDVQTISPIISGRSAVWYAATFDGTPTVRAGAAGQPFLGGTTLTGVAAGYTVPRTFGALPADARSLGLALTGTRLLAALYQS